LKIEMQMVDVLLSMKDELMFVVV